MGRETGMVAMRLRRRQLDHGCRCQLRRLWGAVSPGAATQGLLGLCRLPWLGAAQASSVSWFSPHMRTGDVVPMLRMHECCTLGSKSWGGGSSQERENGHSQSKLPLSMCVVLLHVAALAHP